MAGFVEAMWQDPRWEEMFEEVGWTTGFVGEVKEFRHWLGQQHPRRIWGEVMSNAIAALIKYCEERSRDEPSREWQVEEEGDEEIDEEAGAEAEGRGIQESAVGEDGLSEDEGVAVESYRSGGTVEEHRVQSEKVRKLTAVLQQW